MSLDCLVEAMTTGGGVLYSDKYTHSHCDSYSTSSSPLPSPRRRGRGTGRLGMDDNDKLIYNSLGDTSGAKGKVSESARFNMLKYMLER